MWKFASSERKKRNWIITVRDTKGGQASARVKVISRTFVIKGFKRKVCFSDYATRG